MKNTIYCFILLIPFATLPYNDEYHLYNQKYKTVKQQPNQQPQRINNHHRRNFIHFIRTHHQPVSKKHLIHKLLHLSTQQLKIFFNQNGIFSKQEPKHHQALIDQQNYLFVV